MDFLAAYLFPNGDRVIDEFVPTGVQVRQATSHGVFFAKVLLISAAGPSL